MKVKYDNEKINDKEKIAICYRLYGLLQKEHNEKGRQYRSGHIKKSEWRTYKKEPFNNKKNAITDEIEKLKNKLKDDKTINATLNDFEAD